MNQSNNLDLTLEFHKEEIKLYSECLKEIFITLKAIQNNSIKEILDITNKNLDIAFNKKIQHEIKMINIILEDINSLFKVRKIDELRQNIMKLKNSVYCYEQMYEPQYDTLNYTCEEEIAKKYDKQQKKAVQLEPKIKKEQIQNEKLYGKDFANYKYYKQLSKIYGSSPYLTELENFFAKNNIPEWAPETFKHAFKRKNYTKFFIKAYNPELELFNVSKRNLPTEIFKYLFINGFLSENDLATYSRNQFGRTFETKRGDILTEDEMINNQKNLHRYNKIDFSKIFNSKFDKILYISNQWDYNSIKNFTEHINETYKGIIFTNEEKE